MIPCSLVDGGDSGSDIFDGGDSSSDIFRDPQQVHDFENARLLACWGMPTLLVCCYSFKAMLRASYNVVCSSLLPTYVSDNVAAVGSRRLMRTRHTRKEIILRSNSPWGFYPFQPPDSPKGQVARVSGELPPCMTRGSPLRPLGCLT